jgi:hypothetical protein
MTDNESKVVEGCVGLCLLPVQCVVEAWAIRLVWGWFGDPILVRAGLHALNLSMLDAFGLSLAVGILNYKPTSIKSEFRESGLAMVVGTLIGIPVVVGIAWMVHQWQ